ncbi:MAG TPA: autotransporter strand-loop-strand O-heptosyltransferase [Stellaceae bacterium]|nr:autotransporter strand-loop-strand O-heptosyltransferase [Stellaceae bacterium]
MPDETPTTDQAKPPYMPAVPLPTQEGPAGLRFDFNEGCRVMTPADGATWRVRLTDRDTGNVLFETQADFGAGLVRSAKRYFIRFRIEAWREGEAVFTHDYDARDRAVLVQLYPHTLGDGIGWFPNAVRFQQRHGCRLTCAMNGKLIPLFRGAYPQIDFVPYDAVDTARFYASYIVGVFFDAQHYQVLQPTDFRIVGLHRTAAYILGLEPDETPPRVALDDGPRPIPEPYVCIAVQSTGQGKYWNNPQGWPETVRYLKEMGYRVICIDRDAVHGQGTVWNRMPPGAEDQTGDRPLLERARWLRHADFFIGLSSGLSWLAWAVGTPVVMISGFTHPINEFATPYRIINYHVCNSCWNDLTLGFEPGDFIRCPRHQGTPRQFECTAAITAEHVKTVLRRIPGFGRARRTAPK